MTHSTDSSSTVCSVTLIIPRVIIDKVPTSDVIDISVIVVINTINDNFMGFELKYRAALIELIALRVFIL